MVKKSKSVLGAFFYPQMSGFPTDTTLSSIGVVSRSLDWQCRPDASMRNKNEYDVCTMWRSPY